MSQSRKKSHDKKETSMEIAEDDHQQALKDLGEALIEELHEKDQDSLEVFDLYTHALKAKFYLRDRNFCPRLVKGYDVLLETLKK